MNNRIKELARQSYIRDSIDRNPKYKPSDVTDYLLDDLQGTFQIFAESIIKECYLWVRDNDGCPDEVDYLALKQHFGIEDETH